MAILKRREPVHPELDVTNEIDVLGMRRLTDHPVLAVLVTRRSALHAKLDALAQQHKATETSIAAIERSQAQAIAELGDQWAWPDQYRQAKVDLQDYEAQTRAVQGGLVELEQQIEDATAEARVEIESKLNTLRLPLVQAVVAALQTLVGPNSELHRVERASARLTGSASWHLFDPSLGDRLRLVDRSAASIARAAQGAQEAVGAAR